MSKKAFTAQEDEHVIRPAPASAREVDTERILNAVQGIRFGEVRVIIQDGVIVQIERVEKLRLR